MARTLNLPVGYAQITATFAGLAVPTGAAIVFGVQNQGSLTATQVATAVKNAAHGAGSLFVTPNNWVQAINISSWLAKLGPLATGPSAVVADGTSYGSVAGDAVVPNSAVLLTKNTSIGGRRGKGRMFIPGIAESSVDQGGKLAAGVQTSITTAATTFLSALQLSGVPMVLLHDYDPALGQSPTAPTLVDSMSTGPIMATQRDRLRR